MDPKLFKHTTLMTIMMVVMIKDDDNHNDKHTLMTIMMVVMIKMMTTTMTNMSVDLVCESEALTHSAM